MHGGGSVLPVCLSVILSLQCCHLLLPLLSCGALPTVRQHAPVSPAQVGVGIGVLQVMMQAASFSIYTVASNIHIVPVRQHALAGLPAPVLPMINADLHSG